jgi:hypothetical protein
MHSADAANSSLASTPRYWPSARSVCMGAMTYIGNGLNFMVKSTSAAQADVELLRLHVL